MQFSAVNITNNYLSFIKKIITSEAELSFNSQMWKNSIGEREIINGKTGENGGKRKKEHMVDIL